MVGATVDGSANFHVGAIGQDRGEHELASGVVESTLSFGLGIGSETASELHLAMCAARSP